LRSMLPRLEVVIMKCRRVMMIDELDDTENNWNGMASFIT
jgi:hypothetical protein